MMTDNNVTPNPDETPVEEYVTPQQAADYSGMSVVHLRHMAKAGRIKAQKFGFFWMIHLGDLKAYLERARNSGDGRLGPRMPKQRKEDLSDSD